MDDSLQPHILSQIPIGVWCKNLDLNYTFINQRCLEMLHLQAADIIGSDDYELPWDIYAEDFRNADRSVMRYKPLAILHPVLLSNGKELTIVSRKSPLKNSQGQITGVLGLVTIVANRKVIDSSRILNQIDAELFGNQSGFSQYFLDAEDHCNLTPKEKECLFYLIRGKTNKEIAKILAISVRTIEHRIDNIKVKFSCYRKSDLISKAIEYGYVNMISTDLLGNSLDKYFK